MTPDTLERHLNDNLTALLSGHWLAEVSSCHGYRAVPTMKRGGLTGAIRHILRRRPFSADSVANLEGNILGLSLVDEAAVIRLATSTEVPSRPFTRYLAQITRSGSLSDGVYTR